jgi:tetratricopeptide (TPR) repeat protein
LEKLERVFAFVKLTSEFEFPNRTLTLRYRFVHALYQNALYADLRATRRAALSGAVAQSLLSFYGEQSGSIPAELASLFETARDFAKAADYFLIAAQNASRVFAYSEAITLAGCGLAVLKTLPDLTERRRQELNLQLTLGMSLAVTKGWAFKDVAVAFKRAQELCQHAGEDLGSFTALYGLLLYYAIRSEMETARELGEELLRLAEKEQDSVRIVAVCFVLGSTLKFLGELELSEKHLKRGLDLYDSSHDYQAYTLISEPGIGCGAQLARVLWLLGYPDKALEQARQTIALARQQPHPGSLGFALIHVAVLHQLRSEASACQELTETVIALSREKDIADNIAWATIWQGWSLAMQGQAEAGITNIHEGLAALRVMGSEIALSWILSLQIEVLLKVGQREEGLAVVEEALAFVHKNQDRVFEAELYRLKGEALLINQQSLEAEGCFRQAIEVARRQRAKSLELRAATSLARLWEQQGKRAEARQMLAEIYGWFTEGFDTADLKDAKALLEELSSESSLQAVSSTTEDKLKLELSTPTPSIHPD